MKKKNPNDPTGRNNNARKKEIAETKLRFHILEEQIQYLARRLNGIAPGHDIQHEFAGIRVSVIARHKAFAPKRRGAGK